MQVFCDMGKDGGGWTQGGQGWERRAGRVLGPLADGALDVGENEAGRGGGGGHTPGAEDCRLAVGGEEAAAWAYVVLSSEGGE